MNIRILTFIAATVVASVSTAPLYADGATVIDDFGCTIGSSASGLSATLFSSESHSVVTPSGNSTLICHFDVPDALRGEVKGSIHNSGFICNTFGGITTNTKAKTNKNRVVLICQI